MIVYDSDGDIPTHIIFFWLETNFNNQQFIPVVQ